MSKNKLVRNTEVCGDCGSPEIKWASINRGILLCVQCCSTHRSLGRNISLVKSLTSQWPAPLLKMVKTLNSSGANGVWEHSLDAKKKPNHLDSLEDKAKFIKAKHQKNEFLLKPNWEDGQLCIENELGKQLHASVRSSNLLTSFKLLIQGADPNYFHDEKGSTPLHAAVRAEQDLQVELLLVYGADPTYPDALGKTPIDYARVHVSNSIQNCLLDVQYEVIDKFHQYLYLRKPDHQLGVHYLAPHSSKPNAAASEKLKKLPNDLFEELIKDVYDEVERRETEAVWLGSSDSIELCAVPFLPVDPFLSTTRNQSRQKLGRFASPELKALINAILQEVQRRESDKTRSSQLDEDPLYDSVASDDDYATVSPDEDPKKNSNNESKNTQTIVFNNLNNNESCETLRKQLQESASKVKELKLEVSNLKSLIEHLSSANYELRVKLSQQAQMQSSNQQNGNHSFDSRERESGYQSLDPYLLNKSLTNSHAQDNGSEVTDGISSMKKGQRPSSMYETREGLRNLQWQTMKNQSKQKGQSQSGPTLMQCTEQVTKGISDLCKCMQSSNRENCISYADILRDSVINLTKTIPSDSGCVDIIKHLLNSASHLQTSCMGLQTSCKMGETSLADKYIQSVRMWAYEIAKETKFVVTKYGDH